MHVSIKLLFLTNNKLLYPQNCTLRKLHLSLLAYKFE